MENFAIEKPPRIMAERKRLVMETVIALIRCLVWFGCLAQNFGGAVLVGCLALAETDKA